MDKQEFIDILKQSLSGEIPDYEVENNVRYYEGYLVNEGSKTIEDKIRELGEPRLIAKTIIDAYTANHEMSEYKNEYYSHSYDEGYEENVQKENRHKYSNVKYYSWDTMAWYQKLIAAFIGIIIIFAFISLIGLGINIFFSIILPVLLVIFGIKFIMNLFRK